MLPSIPEKLKMLAGPKLLLDSHNALTHVLRYSIFTICCAAATIDVAQHIVSVEVQNRSKQTRISDCFTQKY